LLFPLAVPGKFSLALLAPSVCMALAFWNKADNKAASASNLEAPEGELLPGDAPGRGPCRDSARALLSGLEAEDAVVRAQAARALGECKDPQAWNLSSRLLQTRSVTSVFGRPGPWEP